VCDTWHMAGGVYGVWLYPSIHDLFLKLSIGVQCAAWLALLVVAVWLGQVTGGQCRGMDTASKEN